MACLGFGRSTYCQRRTILLAAALGMSLMLHIAEEAQLLAAIRAYLLPAD